MAKQRRKRGTAGDKTICLPLADDLDYATLVADREAFRLSWDHVDSESDQTLKSR
jgi:hypothetical protein